MLYRISRYYTKSKNCVVIFNSITVPCRNLKKRRCLKIFINTGILYLLFTRLWTLPTDFVLTQVNIGYDVTIFNYILSTLYESRLILIINKKYGKWIFRNHFTSGVLWYDNSLKWFFNLSLELHIAWSFLFFLVLE